MTNNVKQLMKELLMTIPAPESDEFTKMIADLGVFERLALLEFLMNPTDLNYTGYVLHKLDEEQTRLIDKEVHIDQWPRQLQDPEWDIKIFYSLMPEDIFYGEISPGCKNFLIPESSKRIQNLWRLRIPKSSLPDGDSSSQIQQDTPQATNKDVGEGEPRYSKGKANREGNPFVSDKFGTVLGEPEEPRGLGNRRVR